MPDIVGHQHGFCGPNRPLSPQSGSMSASAKLIRPNRRTDEIDNPLRASVRVGVEAAGLLRETPATHLGPPVLSPLLESCNRCLLVPVIASACPASGHCPRIVPNSGLDKKKAPGIVAKCLTSLVGGAGFEPATPAV